MTDETENTVLKELRVYYRQLAGKKEHHSWDEDELRGKIADLEGSQEERATVEPKEKRATIAVAVKRDFWDENEVRQPAGTVIEVSVEEALDGVERGHFVRVR